MIELTLPWLLFAWFLLCVVVGLAADATGRTGVAWFVAALLLTPFVPGLVIFLLPAREIKRQSLQHWPGRNHPKLR
jgi:hypothetical protein